MTYSKIPYYYINLEDRIDRNIHILDQFNRFNITNYHRVSAIKENNGHIGCSKSHILAIEKFITSDKDIGILLEDDFEFIISSSLYYSILEHILNTDIEWDVILLSGNIKKQKKYNQFLNICYESQTSSGYILNKRYCKTLLTNFIEGLKNLEETGNHIYCLDQNWKKLQNQDKWFVTNPKCGKQRNDYSDIEKKVVSYKC